MSIRSRSPMFQAFSVSITIESSVTRTTCSILQVLFVTWHTGHAMAQALVTSFSLKRPRFSSQASPCRICDGQSGTGTVLSLSFFGFPLSISFHQVFIFVHVTCRPEFRETVSPHWQEHDTHLSVSVFSFCKCYANILKDKEKLALIWSCGMLNSFINKRNECLKEDRKIIANWEFKTLGNTVAYSAQKNGLQN
jgi:hypothetical protein